MLQSRCVELFPVATVLDEILLETPDLLVKQKVRLMNQANDCIGSNFGALVL